MRPTRFWAAAEGLILAGLGLAMLMLACSQDYWMLLNPKFRWLTGGAGGLLVLCGLAAALAQARRAGPLRPVVLAALLVVALAWDLGAWSQPGVGTGGAAFNPKQRERIVSRLSLDGREYIKINLAELFILAEKADPLKTRERYVFRAQVVNTPGLAAKGRLAVVRLNVWCCLADAVWMGFTVEPPPGDKPATGQWVAVYGRLVAREGPPQASEAVRDRATNRISAINQSFVFKAEVIKPIASPPLPYMFQTRQREPYAY